MVCCYHCGVEMKDWMPGDDVWLRHARQSPNCRLMLNELGEQYAVSQINELGRSMDTPARPVLNVRLAYVHSLVYCYNH